MIVQRWGILQTAMPSQFSIPKNIALVGALTKLHNFCIDINTNRESDDTLLDLDADQVYTTTNESGYVVVESDNRVIK